MLLGIFLPDNLSQFYWSFLILKVGFAVLTKIPLAAFTYAFSFSDTAT